MEVKLKLFDFCERTAFIYGADTLDKLQGCTVAVAGLGGVGSACAEGLTRLGIGKLVLIDSDCVSKSNCNRQLVATFENLGKNKTDECKKRLLSINPQLEVITELEKISDENFEFIFKHSPNIVVDAIDTVSAKLKLVQECTVRGIPIICSMGAGNRTNPTCIRLGDIADTRGTGCGLSKVMRRELRRLGIGTLPVVYSVEQPQNISIGFENGRHPPASTPFVPPVAGFALAYSCTNMLLNKIGVAT